MKWAINPFFKPREDRTEESPADVEAAPASDSSSTSPSSSVEQSTQHGFKRPTERFTAYQLFYIFVLDGIGAMIVSGGINFAIAYGKPPLALFSLIRHNYAVRC